MVVADGTQLNVSAVVRGFQWIIQQTKFTSDMLLIPLGCCDLALGVEWLVSLGDIVWNFNKLQMEFYVKIQKSLNQWRHNDNPVIQKMTTNMQLKFNKYWESGEINHIYRYFS